MNRRQFLLPVGATIAGGAMIGWFGWNGIGADHASSAKGVVVVPGGAANDAAPRPAPVAPVQELPVPDLGALTVTERQDQMTARKHMRAPETEALLVENVTGTLPGLAITDVVCAGGLCEVTGTLSIAAGDSVDTAVARLMHGGFQRGFQGAGFAENGSITIDVDDAGNLRFVQYLQSSTNARGP